MWEGKMAHPIVLSTLNATYQHCAFGLRYLLASLGDLRDEALLLEFTLAHNPRDVAERILAEHPRLVGLGVYVWNARQTRETVAILKAVRPDLVVVLGGPEVSHESEGQEICRIADLTIRGEGELLFRDVCREYLSSGRLPHGKFLSGPLPDVRRLASPYSEYSDEDIRHRVIYVEASRGCPFT